MTNGWANLLAVQRCASKPCLSWGRGGMRSQENAPRVPVLPSVGDGVSRRQTITSWRRRVALGEGF